MISATAKNKIIGSYALVLSEILKNNDDAINILDSLSSAINSYGDLSKFIVNPSILEKYNNFAVELNKNVDKTDSLCAFINQIVKRRYLFLLSDIVEKAKYNMKNRFNTKKVVVYSGSELCEDMKVFISNVIKEKVGVAILEYRIKKNLKSDIIDFVSDGQVCSIDLKKVYDIFFNS